MISHGKKFALERPSKGYGGVPVIKDMSLDIPAGCFCTLLGASGSGKSTLLKMIAGFESPDAGRILVDDKDIAPIPVRRRNIGMVFQNFALLSHMSAAENVAFGLEMRGMRRRDVAARVQDALAMVGLQAFADRKPRELSGGQQQRVALARALVIEPGILLMDEPLGALDKSLRRALQEELRSLHARLAVTIVFVTHDQEEALHLSDLLVVRDQGRIAQAGDPRQIYRAPASRFVARFLGECNEIEFDGRIYALRPERVHLGSAADVMTERVQGTITEVRLLGSTLRVVNETRHGQFVALAATGQDALDLATGQTIVVGYSEQDLAPLNT